MSYGVRVVGLLNCKSPLGSFQYFGSWLSVSASQQCKIQSETLWCVFQINQISNIYIILNLRGAQRKMQLFLFAMKIRLLSCLYFLFNFLLKSMPPTPAILTRNINQKKAQPSWRIVTSNTKKTFGTRYF